MIFWKIFVKEICYCNNLKNSGVYEQFCRTRNQIQRDIKKAKASYFSDKIEENKNNPKGLWKQFKSLAYSSKGKDQSQIVLIVNGEKCYNSTIAVDCFNEFYTNVVGNLVKNLPPSAFHKMSDYEYDR